MDHSTLTVEMKSILAEKDALLREIHHRVKNNLQVIIALIEMQAEEISDENVVNRLRELQEQARAMALVHETLYRSPNLSRVDFANYLHMLTAFLGSSYGLKQDIRIDVEAQDIYLDIATATPCGLLVNELVTNALKYAFPLDQRCQHNSLDPCRVCIVLTMQGRQVTLRVSDNGIGLPPDLDWQNTSSLGLQLVNILTHQLNGRISLKRAGGTCFCIMFPRSRETASS